MYAPFFVVIASLPELLYARALQVRDSVSCSYSVVGGNGDTCQSLADSWGISLADFQSFNPGVGCPNIVVGQNYCVIGTVVTGSVTSSSTPMSTTTPKQTTTASATTTSSVPNMPTQSGITSDCKSFYDVQAGDTCDDIVNKYGTFTLNDFYQWNPAISSKCTNLQPGYYVCVGVTGTPTSAPSSTAGIPSPTPSGVISTCTKYATAHSDGSCFYFARNHGISEGQLYAWNSVFGRHGEHCDQFKGGENYCIAVSGPLPAPGPTQPGIVDTCVEYYETNPGGSCDSFAYWHGISKPQLFAMNTVLGPNGENCQSKFWANTYYCSAVAGPDPYQPRQDGVISTCTKYAQAVSGDSCQSFPGRYGISSAQLYAWNSVLGYYGEHCDQLISGNYYCTGVSGPLQPKGPSQPGITDACTGYGKAVSGSTCPEFASSNHISTAQLYSWNPVLGQNGENCQTKFLGAEYYCVQAAG
ncbi:Hypothetical protein R9X50_00761900 [Acrodontium crateriforme]|uniref:LysM domain-containing protein n=1 Tax=Acrodontium crateriforme TaxID=150365 RepID=A0AAQ3RAW1_9PEZI|nr:Hypothetical protein R9X50_00761900 [Acrodontium crateriforme]